MIELTTKVWPVELREVLVGVNGAIENRVDTAEHIGLMATVDPSPDQAENQVVRIQLQTRREDESPPTQTRRP